MEDINGHDLLALLIIEGVTQMPYDVAQELKVGDPLWVALMRRIQEKRKEQDLRFGILASTVANMAGKTAKGTTSAQDFYASLRETKEEEMIRKNKEVQANMMAAMRLYRNTDRKG